MRIRRDPDVDTNRGATLTDPCLTPERAFATGTPGLTRRGGINWLALATVAMSLAAISAVLYALILRNAQTEVRMGTEHEFVGVLAPATELEDLDRKQSTSLIELRGKLVLLVFWGTWSSSSRQLAPLWNKIWESHRDHPKFAMVTVACESAAGDVHSKEDHFADEIRSFMEQERFTYPVWRDPEGLARGVYSMDRGEYPLTVLISPEGYMLAVWYGFVPGMQADLERLVNRFLTDFGEG